MLELLGIIPLCPLAGFIALVIGRRLSARWVALIGAGSIGAAAALTSLVAISFFAHPPAGAAYSQHFWTWMKVGSFAPGMALRLDALSLTFLIVITIVGFLIHLYSTQFMAGEEGYGRYFAYMNLFVFSMIVLVLGSNLLLLFLGWEGVGLCSYLLIGFWYKDAANGRAAIKAFVVTRVGDAALAVGLFLLFTSLGTLNIQALMHRAQAQWPPGSAIAVAAGLLLLAGAVGKSAQLPLQTWLPDAMAGPTPVSALIHSATMVTAGVYLIARTNVIFTLAPAAQLAVAIVGAATLLLSGFSALTQRDIKRVLAYSTISQIGYMFLALGVGAWNAAIFHFATHALFKSLLFLGAGAVLLSLNKEHDMFKMGGLRKAMPLTFWCFLAGALVLAAVPPLTAFFTSKDLILYEVWVSPKGGALLWAIGLFGAFLTAAYTFRMVFITFFGPMQQKPTRKPGKAMAIALVTLAVLASISGLPELRAAIGSPTVLSHFLRTTMPASPHRGPLRAELTMQGFSEIASLSGIFLAYVLFLRHRSAAEKLVATPAGRALQRYWFAGWGFDWAYDRLFVRPIVWLARINKSDFVDWFYRGIAWASDAAHRVLRATQTGNLRWYAAGVAFGAIVVIAMAVFL